MTNVEPGKRERAVHESGHAVAAFLAFQSRLALVRCDEPMFESVTIVSERGSCAHCKPFGFFFIENRNTDSFDWLVAEVAVYKAGQLADIIVNNKKLPENCYKNDNDQVEDLFSTTSPFNEDKVHIVKEAERRVTTWFKTEFVRKAIDQLANELERSGTLEWYKCEQIIAPLIETGIGE